MRLIRSVDGSCLTRVDAHSGVLKVSWLGGGGGSRLCGSDLYGTGIGARESHSAGLSIYDRSFLGIEFIRTFLGRQHAP